MTSMTVRQIAEICFFTLLSKDKKAQSQVIEEFYAPNCVFEDPLLSVNSSKSLLAQFSILSSICLVFIILCILLLILTKSSS